MMEIVSPTSRVTCQGTPLGVQEGGAPLGGALALLGADTLLSSHGTQSCHHSSLYHEVSSTSGAGYSPDQGNEWMDINPFTGYECPTDASTPFPGPDCQFSGYSCMNNEMLSPASSGVSTSGESGLSSPGINSPHFHSYSDSSSGMGGSDTSSCISPSYPHPHAHAHLAHPYPHEHNFPAGPAQPPSSVVSARTWTGGFHPAPSAAGNPPFSSPGKSATSKPKRRRVINRVQRKAANHRERTRMVTLNDAFHELTERIPKFSTDKKISRIETLRVAISYISFMSDIVAGKHPHIDTKNIESVLNKYRDSMGRQ